MITAFAIRHNIICGRWSPQFVAANYHNLCNSPQYYMWQEITTVGCGQWSQPLQFTTIYYMWQVITAYDDVKLVFIYLNTILVPSILNMMYDPLCSLLIKLLLPQPKIIQCSKKLYRRHLGSNLFIIIFWYMKICFKINSKQDILKN